MRVGVVDIGTNSMRLLITDGVTEEGRWVEVTGLGRGVDSTGRLGEEPMEETIRVLGRFGGIMEEAGVEKRRAIATSASRDAENREEFFDRAEQTLGVRPTLISGHQEARYAFIGASIGLDAIAPVLVSDIGGGSTEFVTETGERSVDIGSVRLTERALPSRPAPADELDSATKLVRRLFSTLEVEHVESVVGVAGTWTSLAAIAQDLPEYRRDRVHGYALARSTLEGLVDQLSGLTVEETEAIPSLDPRRAPVLLAGAVIATEVADVTGIEEVLVAETDTLDGVATEMLAIS